MAATVVGSVLILFGLVDSTLAGRFAQRAGGYVTGGTLFGVTLLPVLTGIAIGTSDRILWWLLAMPLWLLVAGPFRFWSLMTWVAPPLYGWLLWGWLGGIAAVVVAWLATSTLVYLNGLQFPQDGGQYFVRRDAIVDPSTFPEARGARFAEEAGLGERLPLKSRNSPYRFDVSWCERDSVESSKRRTFATLDEAVRFAKSTAVKLGCELEITDYAVAETKNLEFMGGSVDGYRGYTVSADGIVKKSDDPHLR